MGKEFELKYAATEASLAAVETYLALPAQEIKMETAYFDTPSGALSARKWTLRLRKENEKTVVTLKTAGDGSSRGEWEYSADSVSDAAERLVPLGAPEELKSLLKEGVAPVCGAKFIRRAVTVTQENAVVEVALDKGILFRGERELPFCEVEAELKQGSEDACHAFAGELARQFGLREELRSKFVRAVTL